MLIIQNCKFIPELTEGTELTNANVYLENGFITRITEAVPVENETNKADGIHLFEEYDPKEKVQVLDAKGMTLLPGLIDMHTHMQLGGVYGSDLASVRPTIASQTLDCLKYVQTLLSLGYTTIRDVGDVKGNPTFAIRDAIQAGKIVGPRMICSGLTLCPHERGVYDEDGMVLSVDSPMEMRKAVRTIIGAGADMVKIYASGSMLSPGSLADLKILEEDEVLEAVKIAKSKGTYVAAHCHAAEAVDICQRSGVRTLEHASFITEETAKRLSGKQDQGIVITLACTEPEVNATDGYSDEVQKRFEQTMQRVYECLRRAYELDVLIGWGTDCSMNSYIKYPYAEFKARKEHLGFNNIDILKQATINSARLLGIDNEIGTVKVGKEADLVLVDGDPKEDITVMYKPVRHVIKSGMLIR